MGKSQKGERHSMFARRLAAKESGETLIERELCEHYKSGTCRRANTCRFLHSTDEWVKLDALEKAGTVGTIQTLRNCVTNRPQQ